MKKFTFDIHIGDWSDDGHGKKETFFIESNKPVKDVREAYFNAKKLLLPILCPENFMDDHGDHSLPREVYECAKELGYDFFTDEFLERVSLEEALEYPDMGPEELLKYLLWYIKQGDPKLKLKVIKVETFSFYGNDEKERHIGYIGYGLFGD